MTGYGKCVAELRGRKINVEIRSLNSKQFDLSIKVPSWFREKENEVRTLLMQRLERGKIDLSIYSDSSGEAAGFSLNLPLASRYKEELLRLADALGEARPAAMLPLILKMPDIMQSSREDADSQDLDTVLTALEEALRLVDEFRAGEGKILEEDIRLRVNNILSQLEAIEPYEKNRLNELRDRLLSSFTRYSDDFNGSAPDQNRFEQELIYYLEKLDITEEKVRLRKHCLYFLDTLDENSSQGKKMGFITQEMGREINTIGSKASDAEIQKIVVQMKDELEKIKEQLGNIL